MTKTDLADPDLEEHLAPGPERTDAEYLAWKDAKVLAARKQARDFPERLVPHARMRERFGL